MKANEQLESRYYGDKHAATMYAAETAMNEESFDLLVPESHITDIAIMVIAATLLSSSLVLWMATA